jgi:uncharacterized protein
MESTATTMYTQVTLERTVPGSGHAFTVILDARRVAYLPQTGHLLVSDLHWGKSETFQRHGIPIPDSLLQSDLSRLTALIETYQPKSLLVLGDLIHGKLGLSEELNRKILAWRAANPLPIHLIIGNHDRSVRLVAEQWDIELVGEQWRQAPFLFSHHPETETNWFNWCGHIHPMVQLRSQHDSLRLPCFHLTPTGATLPAFSAFTGGTTIKPSLADEVFALSEGHIIPVTST